jgi:hypothetical protein
MSYAADTGVSVQHSGLDLGWAWWCSLRRGVRWWLEAALLCSRCAGRKTRRLLIFDQVLRNTRAMTLGECWPTPFPFLPRHFHHPTQPSTTTRLARLIAGP